MIQPYSHAHFPPMPVLDVSFLVYELDLRIGDLVLPAVDVAGDPFSGEILLGRNVLNCLDLRLEGPALRTHLPAARVRR